MKNGKDRAKKEIKEILKNNWQKGNPLLIWMAIRDIIELHGLESNFSYQEFKRLFQTFQNICRVDFNKALEGFLSFFDSKTKTNNIPKISKIKVTKVKQERMPQWKLLKSAWDLLHKHDSQNYLSEEMQGLIMFKSFLLQCDSDKVKSSDKKYILHFYGISQTEFMKNSELQEKVEKIHWEAEAAISYFRMMLKMIPWILKKHNPVATYCLIDVFGHSAKHYIALPVGRKSYNKPNYKQIYNSFRKFVIDGKTPKQMGYTSSNWNKFTERIRPQGAIIFLYEIHTLLYGLSDEFDEKKNKITELCKSLPLFLYRKVLKELYTAKFSQ